jgi:hypothetical protein
VSKFKYISIGVLIGVVVSGIMLLVLKKTGAIDENQEVQNPISDTVVVAAEPEVQIERVVEKVNVPSNDTVMLLTNINQNVDSGDYVVLRDELLSSRKVNILQKSKTSSGSPSDALIDRVSSDDFFAESILVEFWESPIDYQGYRLNKTKLILFGINPNESFELTNQHEGFLLLNSGGQTVILYPTEKYRTFNFQ